MRIGRSFPRKDAAAMGNCRENRRSAGESVGWEAFYAKSADDEEASGVFFDFGFVDSGGDVEVFEGGTAEGAGGGFEAGEVDAAEDFSGHGSEADDAGAVAEGDPEVAVFIDGHAVG